MLRFARARNPLVLEYATALLQVLKGPCRVFVPFWANLSCGFGPQVRFLGGSESRSEAQKIGKVQRDKGHRTGDFKTAGHGSMEGFRKRRFRDRSF